MSEAEKQRGPDPTTDQIRASIDRGQTGDKVAHSDPAASPLGTDDEAAGTPPDPERRRIAAERSSKPPSDPDA